jgi:Homeodomain-like domain
VQDLSCAGDADKRKRGVDIMEEKNTPTPTESQYAGLPQLLHAVRWSQHLLAIVAEILILLSFAMSGMDVSLGGVMAGIPLLKVLWAAMFALGIDTAFALSWVRVRQCAVSQRWGAFTANLLLAIGMSFIVFQPVAIQLFQQSMSIDFTQAMARLGINLVALTYARAGVAVFLGAILAMTNREGEHLIKQGEQVDEQGEQNTEMFPLSGKIEISVEQPAMPLLMGEHQGEHQDEQGEQVRAEDEQRASTSSGDGSEDEQKTKNFFVLPDQGEQGASTSTGGRSEGEQGASSRYERVRVLLAENEGMSDRELAEVLGCSSSTANKWKRKVLKEREV